MDNQQSIPKQKQLVPAILAKDEIDFAQKLRRVEGQVEWVQIDIMDNTMVPFKSFHDADVVKSIINPLNYELHLMVDDPVPIVKEWTEIDNTKRAIVHAEMARPVGLAVKTLKVMELKVGLALNPETKLEDYEELMPKLDLILFLGVAPGQSGQEFDPAVLDKIKQARAKYPEITIAVDGGVKLDNAPGILAAGADHLCVASAIYKAEDVRQAIADFKNLLS